MQTKDKDVEDGGEEESEEEEEEDKDDDHDMDEVNRVKEGRQPERQLLEKKADVHATKSKSASKEAPKEQKHDTKSSSNQESKPLPDKNNISIQTDL